MKESETSEGFFFFFKYKFYEKGWVEFGYIFLWLNGVQGFFVKTQ